MSHFMKLLAMFKQMMNDDDDDDGFTLEDVNALALNMKEPQ